MCPGCLPSFWSAAHLSPINTTSFSFFEKSQIEIHRLNIWTFVSFSLCFCSQRAHYCGHWRSTIWHVLIWGKFLQQHFLSGKCDVLLSKYNKNQYEAERPSAWPAPYLLVSDRDIKTLLCLWNPSNQLFQVLFCHMPEIFKCQWH